MKICKEEKRGGRILMFKHGQIVKSEATGDLYFVKSWPDNLVSVKDQRSYYARDSWFTLVVNNFKYKDSWTQSRAS